MPVSSTNAFILATNDYMVQGQWKQWTGTKKEQLFLPKPMKLEFFQQCERLKLVKVKSTD